MVLKGLIAEYKHIFTTRLKGELRTRDSNSYSNHKRDFDITSKLFLVNLVLLDFYGTMPSDFGPEPWRLLNFLV